MPEWGAQSQAGLGGVSEHPWLEEGFARSDEGRGSGVSPAPCSVRQDILNHVFDDVESFVSKLQKSAEAARVLEHRERGRRTRRRESGGEGRPGVGSRSPPPCSPGHSQIAPLSLGSPLAPPASLALHPNLSGALPLSDAVPCPLACPPAPHRGPPGAAGQAAQRGRVHGRASEDQVRLQPPGRHGLQERGAGWGEHGGCGPRPVHGLMPAPPPPRRRGCAATSRTPPPRSCCTSCSDPCTW